MNRKIAPKNAAARGAKVNGGPKAANVTKPKALSSKSPAAKKVLHDAKFKKKSLTKQTAEELAFEAKYGLKGEDFENDGTFSSDSEEDAFVKGLLEESDSDSSIPEYMDGEERTRVQESDDSEGDDDDSPLETPDEDDSGEEEGDAEEEDEEDDEYPRASKKMALLDSDEEDGDDDEEDDIEDGSDDDMSDDDSYGDLDSDEDGFEHRGGDIVRAAKHAEAARARIEAEAEADLRMQLEDQEAFILPSNEELEKERALPPNLPAIKRRITDIIFVLTDFRTRRDPLRPRGDYINCLAQDFADYFGYNRDLINAFMLLFSPAETLQFLEANETPRPVVIRANTLKSKIKDLVNALVARGVNLEPVGRWTKVGLKVFECPVPIGATPEYLAGHYMLQSASSMVPVIALQPQPGERILDMAAAPGGKTTHIAQLMNGSGVLIANDPKSERLPSLVANLARLGVTNSIVCSYDGKKLPEVVGKHFDRVLLDAPCTGLGVISRDPSAKTTKTNRDIMKMSQLQKQLLLAAIDAVDAHSKTGGIIVYSTCSVAVEENECVVNYAMRKRHIRIEPFVGEDGSDIGRPGLTSYAYGNFHPDVKNSRRFFPHVHNMDGFYVCRIRKISNKIKKEDNGPKSDSEDYESEEETVTVGAKRDRQTSKIQDVILQQQSQKKTKSAVAPSAAKLKEVGLLKLSRQQRMQALEAMRKQRKEEKHQKSREKAKEAIARRRAESAASSEESTTESKPKNVAAAAKKVENTQQKKPKKQPASTGAISAKTAAQPSKEAIASVKAALNRNDEEEDATGKGGKKQRLPVEKQTPAEKSMILKTIEAITSTSTDKIQGPKTPAIKAGTVEKAMNPQPKKRAKAAPTSEDGVVDFVKPGEKLSLKKRKAGKKAREAREQKAKNKATKKLHT